MGFPNSCMVSLQIRVSGRVQGVGYRAAMRERARQLGLTGWVRNRLDGSVEALVHGSPQALDAITDWARRGPRGCNVTQVETVLVDPVERAPASFELKPTA